MINAFDCIIYDYNEIAADSNDAVSQIVSHTANTWQANRGRAEKGRDTKQGKQAEQAVSLFFSKYHTSVKYISYDTIRTDNFLKHAPFDGLLVDCIKVSKTILAEKFAKINKEIAEGSYGVISTELRAELYDAGIYTVEIKSTKVNDKKRTAASFSSYDETVQIKNLLTAICVDDFLTYPHFRRTGDFDWNSYCTFVQRRVPELSSFTGIALQNAIKEIELANMDDFYIRVYMDEIHNKALILGFITKEDFMVSPYIKKMILWGKSENALYLAKPLTARKPLKDLISLIEN